MKFLSTRFPKIYSVLNQFKLGSVQLVKNGRIRYTLKPKRGEIYTPTQLITHREFLSDLRKCLPVFIIFWIPIIGQWVAIPLALLFPQKTLSRQFWTDKQRVSALNGILDDRITSYPSLSSSVIDAIDSSNVDSKLSQVCCDVIEKIGKGKEFGEEESTLFKRMFLEAKTLQIPALTPTHQKCLAVSSGTYLIREHAFYLANVDRSLRHFGLESDSQSIIDLVAHQRGFRLDELHQKSTSAYIKQWLHFTKNIKSKEAELGYLLHLPFLMQNNHKLVIQHQRDKQ